MKIAPNPAAFTSLNDTDFKRVPREHAREVKFSIDPESVNPFKKADAQRADRRADRAQQGGPSLRRSPVARSASPAF